MAEFKPIETQEALDAIIKERVARVEGKYADYAELKAYRDSHKGKDVTALEADIAKLTDQVKSLTEQLTEQTTKAKDATSKLTRMEIGQAAGVAWLPSDFKKKDGYRRSIQLSAEYGLYRQAWCGCGLGGSRA